MSSKTKTSQGLINGGPSLLFKGGVKLVCARHFNVWFHEDRWVI